MLDPDPMGNITYDVIRKLYKSSNYSQMKEAVVEAHEEMRRKAESDESLRPFVDLLNEVTQNQEKTIWGQQAAQAELQRILSLLDQLLREKEVLPLFLLEQLLREKAALPELFEPGILDNYLKEVRADTERIDIRGISSASVTGQMATYYAIEHLYTPLKSAGRVMDKEPEVGDQLTSTTLSWLLAKSGRLLLIGEAGGGKTTFLRLIACVLAKDILGQSQEGYAPGRKEHLGLPLAQDAPLPVFIRLADLAHMMSTHSNVTDHASYRWMLRYLRERYDEPTAKIIKQWLDAGRSALLLDGFDEVAEPALRLRIIDLTNQVVSHWKANLIVMTSRPYSYKDVSDLSGVATAFIDDFGDREIREFLNRWVRALYPDEESRARDKYRPELEKAIIDVVTIRRLARNPVMLTCLCVVHWNERRLPEGKADLLSTVLRWLLNAREKQRRERGYTKTFAEESFKALSLAMMNDVQGKQTTADLDWSAEQLADSFSDELGIDEMDHVRRKGRTFLEEETVESGIVVKGGLGQIRFWHLTFQEHYAARALVDESNDKWWEVIKHHLCDRQWSEVLDHIAGCLALTGRGPLNRLVGYILGTATSDDLPATARAVGVLGRLLTILKAYDDYHPPTRLGWEAAQEQAMAIFTLEGSAQVPVTERIVAAEALGQAGDPRLADPMKNMLSVHEQSNLLLGKYPVTVEEYRRFVNNDGYKQRDLWGEAWQLKQKNKWIEPEDWKEQLETPNRPVVGVSWYEATAYCCWLSARYSMSGQVFRLPTEAEWEAAARHPEGDYPWGKEKPHEELTNFENKVGQPTPVGIYPGGAGRGGHLDLAGNVWEWCQDYRSADVEKGADRRALRGGCFWDVAQGLRASSRGWNRLRAEDRHVLCGFRVALAPPSL